MAARMRLLALLIAGASCLFIPALVAAADLEPLLARSTFEAIKISPTGEHYAATVRLQDRTVLVIFRRSDMQPQARVSGAEGSDIAGFWWVNDQRVVVAMADRLGSLETPVPTGELHAINADGSGARTLVGIGKDPVGSERINILGDFSGAYLVDTLVDDDRHVLIARTDYGSADPLTRVERMNVVSGKRRLVARAPVRRAHFVMDTRGQIRFAIGAGSDNATRLYHRTADDADWQLLNDENSSGRAEFPLGFSADDSIAYLQVEQAQGPDTIEAWNIATGARRPQVRDPRVDPYEIVSDAQGAVVGTRFMDDGIRTVHFDSESVQAEAQRRLERTFPGAVVRIASRTRDDRLWVLRVSSDRDPGRFFLFDTEARKAEFIFALGKAEADAMRPAQAVDIEASDGLALRGYLTRPQAADQAGPLVLLVHGGPFGVFDSWEYDLDTQVLALAGYSVLRVNYRGSGNYGRAHMRAGAREWGGRMQQDLADAARWAIARGIADPERIALVGGSYGGYAALMGAVAEPELFHCVAGYVGVYDLTLVARKNARTAGWTKRWTEDWVGSGELLEQRSPTRLADRIRVPVLLVAGEEDPVAPVVHTQRMERALKAAKVPVETVYVPREGHGFYLEANQRAYYERLTAFLDRHIGQEK